MSGDDDSKNVLNLVPANTNKKQSTVGEQTLINIKVQTDFLYALYYNLIDSGFDEDSTLALVSEQLSEFISFTVTDKKE